MEKQPKTLFTYINYGDSYVQPLLECAIARLNDQCVSLQKLPNLDDVPSEASTLIWAQYESLPFHLISTHPNLLINSYVFRKALIRKHYLATTVRNWLVKHPSSILGRHVKSSVDFEVDYAEFLDDALVEAYELNESLERNEGVAALDREWWILKAGMAERGGGIRLFSTREGLDAIFEGWDPDEDDESDGPADGDRKDEGIVTSQMRHFVAQMYVADPLLLQPPFRSADRKFHIRTYVVCVGALQVFVYRRMLALFAGPEYNPPWETEDPNDVLNTHLTNTCLQNGEREGSVHEFQALPSSASGLSEGWKSKVFDQICDVTGQTFEAAAKGMSIHFQPLPNAFEIFGLDFLVDAQGTPWLLEVNAFPDFAQTGSGLQDLVQGLFDGVVDVAIRAFLTKEKRSTEPDMIKVLDMDLGRR